MYMIHTCLSREWYVRDFLVPSMTAQGIPLDDINIWVDRDGRGNLSACIESFYQVSRNEGETWHLQDDVIICRDFAERTRAAPKGVVCGFCVRRYEKQMETGNLLCQYMWESSFPCIKIPNEIAGEFVEWMVNEANNRGDLQNLVQTGKKDDTLFHIFMLEEHFKDRVTNLSPHLVDHIDWLIGGSVINQTRHFIARAALFEDQDLVEKLKKQLASR